MCFRASIDVDAFQLGFLDRRTVRNRDVYVTQPRMKFSCAEYKYVYECVIGGMTSTALSFIPKEIFAKKLPHPRYIYREIRHLVLFMVIIMIFFVCTISRKNR